MIALIHIFKIMRNDENYLVELKKSVFNIDKRFDVQDTVNWKTCWQIEKNYHINITASILVKRNYSKGVLRTMHMFTISLPFYI